jgi:hypothetical protein
MMSFLGFVAIAVVYAHKEIVCVCGSHPHTKQLRRLALISKGETRTYGAGASYCARMDVIM